MSQDNQLAPNTSDDVLKNPTLGPNISNVIQEPRKDQVRSTQTTPLNPTATSSIPLQQWVSQFQTTLDISPASSSRKEYPNIIDSDNKLPNITNSFSSSNNNNSGLGPAEKKASKCKKPVVIKPSLPLPTLLPKSVSPPNRLAPKEPIGIDQIRQFQTSFQLNSNQPSYNKTSISAIINFDPEPETTSEISSKEKKKKVQKKKSSDDKETQPSKKRKTEKSKDSVDAIANSPLAESTISKAVTESPKKKKVIKPKQTDPKTNETKKSTKSKKKSAEVAVPPNTDPSKSVIHPNMTTERNVINENNILLPSPKIIDFSGSHSDSDVILDNVVNDIPKIASDKENDTEKEKEKEKEKEREKEKKKEIEKEKPEPPIIAINIPLLDPANPKPGQSEVVINVLKLAEDKYGWSVIHPNAKSAIDLMDEIIDDEDDGMEDDVEEDELPILDEQGTASGNSLSKKKKASEKELTEEQLARKHEVKMNRKVGKYDYEDPFIDDEELQWEEEITSTKDGFFVYWGPLVDDRNNTTSSKKASSKSKK